MMCNELGATTRFPVICSSCYRQSSKHFETWTPSPSSFLFLMTDVQHVHSYFVCLCCIYKPSMSSIRIFLYNHAGRATEEACLYIKLTKWENIFLPLCLLIILVNITTCVTLKNESIQWFMHFISSFIFTGPWSGGWANVIHRFHSTEQARCKVFIIAIQWESQGS